MSELINRAEYLNQLIENKDVDLVKIVTGIRRCGKSSLLDLFHRYLLAEGIEDSHIIHINLESLRYRNLNNYLSFYDYISERIPKNDKTYLIFDELILMWIFILLVLMLTCFLRNFLPCFREDM